MIYVLQFNITGCTTLAYFNFPLLVLTGFISSFNNAQIYLYSSYAFSNAFGRGILIYLLYLLQRLKVNLNIMTLKYGFIHMPKANKIPLIINQITDGKQYMLIIINTIHSKYNTLINSN